MSIEMSYGLYELFKLYTAQKSIYCNQSGPHDLLSIYCKVHIYLYISK
jgi:hypothetical protein